MAKLPRAIRSFDVALLDFRFPPCRTDAKATTYSFAKSNYKKLQSKIHELCMKFDVSESRSISDGNFWLVALYAISSAKMSLRNYVIDVLTNEQKLLMHIERPAYHPPSL